jgi:hypothetical protein
MQRGDEAKATGLERVKRSVASDGRVEKRHGALGSGQGPTIM